VTDSHNNRRIEASVRQQKLAAQTSLSLVIWTGGLGVAGVPDAAPAEVAAISMSTTLIHVVMLWRNRQAGFVATRAYQSSQIWWSGVVAFVGAVLAARVIPVEFNAGALALISLATVVALVLHQEISLTFSQPNSIRRRAVVVGTGEEAVEIIKLVADHPEMGIDIAGCVGDKDAASRQQLDAHWLGPTNELPTIIDEERIDIPIVAVTSFRRPALHRIMTLLRATGRDVMMSWGVERVSASRTGWQAFSHEALPLIRAQHVSKAAVRIKRVAEVAVAVATMVLLAPLTVVIVSAIRLDSRGPALFWQTRVGLNSETFEMLKFRTMRLDADADLKQLRADNERTGPLFKMTRDPRVTRVGKILRATSLDELPQLINVVRGEMSLVGPRPALPIEAASFDSELETRSRVRPGITGLWQLEARSNPSFDAYRRLDLHYIENWSLGLDLRIALATMQLLVFGAPVSIARKWLERSRDSKPVSVDVSAPVVAQLTAAPTADAEETTGPTVAVLGAGYVGLIQALGLAELGHRVVCADIDEERVADLQVCKAPILEEGLDDLLRRCVASGRIQFTVDPQAAVLDASVVFLCVATPQGRNGSADLSYLHAAARQVGPHLGAGAVVVNKSTVPVGSTHSVARELGRSDVSVVSNPEFLREGTAIADWRAPDRIVVGGELEACMQVLGLYRHLPGKRIICDARSSELIKYASNAYLATRLTFVNSLSVLCEAIGADALEVTGAMGLDKRIGPKFLQPGPGWGGSCLPKDTNALAFQATEAGAPFLQLQATIDANETHLDLAARSILDRLDVLPSQAIIGVLGLAFKAGTADTRDSPAVKVVKRLRDAGAIVRAFDPAVSHAPFDDITMTNSGVDCAKDADALVVLTEWPEFADIDLDKVAELMTRPLVIDLRNVLDRDEVHQHGLEYTAIGRGDLRNAIEAG